MEKVLISYATPAFDAGIKKLEASALRFGADRVILYRRNNLVRTDFYKRNRHILDAERGAGFWLWKPYYIHETLKMLREGDFLVYSDAGITITSPLLPLFDLCAVNDGVLLFYNCSTYADLLFRLTNSEWTKRDAFILLDCDEPEYHNGRQLVGGFQVYRKCERALHFTGDLLDRCSDPRLITDQLNVCGKENFPDFIEHRHDQSILSLLAMKHGIKSYRDTSQFGNYVKPRNFRKTGEPITQPYSDRPDISSNYGQIIHINRGSRKRGRVRRKIRKAVYMMCALCISVRVIAAITAEKFAGIIKRNLTHSPCATKKTV